MNSRRLMVAVVGSLIATTAALATQERVPLTPIAIEKTYVVEPPLGKIRVSYALDPGTGVASLSVESSIFRTSVPAEGLAALPRPDWDRMTITYLQSIRSNEQDQPSLGYVNVRVPLRGPPDGSWGNMTSVWFVCRVDGSVKRRLVSGIDRPERVIDWPIGSKESTETTLGHAVTTTRPTTP